MSKRFLLNCALTVVVLALLVGKTISYHPGEVLFTGWLQVKKQAPLLVGPATPSMSASAASASSQLQGQLSAQSAVILDVGSKKILWQKNAHTQQYPASTTKIITALVANDIYDWDDVITLTSNDLQYDNNVGWQAGDQVTVADLLASLLVLSANEAGMALANHAPGGYDSFVAAMNQKVQELGLRDSHFVNPQGYDDASQQTTAWDLAIAALELLRIPRLAAIVSQPTVTVSTQAGRDFQLRNTNQLLSRTDLPYLVKGIKTGTTHLASEALVSLLEQGDKQILVVVLSTKNRYNDTTTLADFAFGNFIWQQLLTGPEVPAVPQSKNSL